MSENNKTALDQPTGHMLKEVINSKPVDRIDLQTKIEYYIASSPFVHSFEEHLQDCFTLLTGEGKHLDIEMYADACKDLLRCMDEDQKENGRDGIVFTNRLPKFTRLHLISWLSHWEQFFKILSLHGATEAYLDLCVLRNGGLNAEELRALDQKYNTLLTSINK